MVIYRAFTGSYILSIDFNVQLLLPEIRDLFDAAKEGNEVVFGIRFFQSQFAALLSIYKTLLLTADSIFWLRFYLSTIFGP